MTRWANNRLWHWCGSVSLRHRVPASRQPHRELGEVADFAVDCNGAAVLLRYDLVADRQSKPGAFAGSD
jgi:hypothetical protein